MINMMWRRGLFIKTQRRKGVGRVGEGIAKVTAVL